MADDGHDPNTLVEAARRHLGEAQLADEALDVLAEVVERYDRLAAEMRRLTEISDRVMSADHTDALTGVYNREHFFELANQELERARRFGRPFSILTIDIDHFERINDQHGRTAGDVVLQALAAANLGILRRIDGFGRLDGDDFAALLPETETTGAVVLAERLREAVANMGVAVGTESIEFTISLGVACWWGSEATVEAMLQRAEEARRAARGEGANKVGIAT